MSAANTTMVGYYICQRCDREQIRVLGAQNGRPLTCKYCGSDALKRILHAPASHSIITVHGPHKTVEVQGNWEEIRDANKKGQNT